MKNLLAFLVLNSLLALTTHPAAGQYSRNTGLLHHPHDAGPLLVVRTVRLSIKPEHRAAFLQATAALETATRQENGCQSFRRYKDPETPNTYLILGEWASERAAAAHFEQPYAQAYFKALPAWLATSATTTSYQAHSPRQTTLQPEKQ